MARKLAPDIVVCVAQEGDGYTEKQITAAMRRLAKRGLVYHDGEDWRANPSATEEALQAAFEEALT